MAERIQNPTANNERGITKGFIQCRRCHFWFYHEGKSKEETPKICSVCIIRERAGLIPPEAHKKNKLQIILYSIIAIIFVSIVLVVIMH